MTSREKDDLKKRIEDLEKQVQELREKQVQTHYHYYYQQPYSPIYTTNPYFTISTSSSNTLTYLCNCPNCNNKNH